MPEISMTVFQPPGQDVPYLVPASQWDKKPMASQRWKHGDVVVLDIRKPRSGPHHRLVFQLLAFVFSNQERFDTKEGLRHWLTLQTSFVTEIQDAATGEIFRMPRSWSYREMDEVEFSQLHDELIPVVLREFWPTETESWLRAGVCQQAFMDGVVAFV